jgi:hypothetical protein
MFSLFCPHASEELWEKIGNKDFISLNGWPIFDEKKIDVQSSEEKEKPKRTLTKFRTVDVTVDEYFAKIGYDCTKIIISYLDQLSQTMLFYTSRYFYNFKNPTHSDISIFIHHSECKKQNITPEQLYFLTSINDSIYIMKYVWMIATRNYRTDVKAYVKILEHIACKHDNVGQFTNRCYICRPVTPLSSNTNTWGIYTDQNIFIGGNITIGGNLIYASRTKSPEVFNAVEVGSHAQALEDGELAIGSSEHPLKIIEKDGHHYINTRINGRKFLLRLDPV